MDGKTNPSLPYICDASALGANGDAQEMKTLMLRQQNSLRMIYKDLEMLKVKLLCSW